MGERPEAVREQPRRNCFAVSLCSGKLTPALLRPWMNSSPGTALLQGEERLGLIVSQARSVELEASLKVLVVPGKRGAFLVVSTVRPDGRPAVFGGGAPLETVLDRGPILTSGATIFGLAPDGITEQRVLLADGSTIGAPVLSNVYVVEDPSWSSPVFADT